MTVVVTASFLPSIIKALLVSHKFRFFVKGVLKNTFKSIKDIFQSSLFYSKDKLLGAIIFQRVQKFYKKCFNKRGKKPPFKKGGQSSLLFKARCFECNSTNHLLADCPKAIEKERGALEAKLEAIKKKKKGKGLIGASNQDSSENEGEEKANKCFMALEIEIQSSPSNFSSFIDDDDDDPNSMLIEMYDELKKISKRNKELRNKIDDLLNENSKLACENKTLLESLEVLKNEKDFSNKEFQKLVLENKNLCEKVFSLEKCMVEYNDLKKR
ncbi:hypothetical protein M9H77_08550 [Catharanthus roseus]|uniref:Uncharacterized protein n=1 Tax=Catharanthus roseus TaxID=4058 RepID=A0ACC0BY60_CATRO|nr:hypothetical protein M9H77_08550 [Catharanthus roseus]